MMFYVKLAIICAVFAATFALLGVIFDQPIARMAVAGIVPGLGIGFGFLTERESQERRREQRRLAEEQAAGEDSAADPS